MKIAIVGAGLTGLVAGYRLANKGHLVTIFEKNSEVGGLLGGFEIGTTSLEKAYHHIFKTDNFIIDLIKELGLEEKLKWHQEKTALYYDEQLYPFMGAMDLLKFKPLDLISKIRLGLVKIWLEKDNHYEKYINTPAYIWMKRWCGEKGYKVIWEPLLRGKFHDKYKEVSMAWLWARIHTRANSKGMLGYVDGGFGQIADELVTKIKSKGGIIKLKTLVDLKEVESNFDKVIYTGPDKNTLYLGSICLVFTSSQSLSKFYWHNINDSKPPFLALIQHTNLVDKKYYGGKNVYYLGTYIPHEHKYFGSEDRLIKKEFFDYLKKVLPEFNKKQILNNWVFKFKNAQHIVDVNYQVPPMKLSDKVYQINFAQIFPEDRGVNFAVKNGEKVAQLM